MKVLLIWCNSRNEVLGWGDMGAIAEPLALEYLAAGLQLDKHHVQILDLRLHPLSLEKTLQEFIPDVVVVTAFSMHVLRAVAVCQQVKNFRQQCWTVVGGHHATFLPEDFFEPVIDFVIAGEGVHPLCTMLRSLTDQQPIAVPGVWSRQNGQFVSGGAPLAFDVNSLPLPNRTLTAHDRNAYFIDWMKPVALLRTSVGCPYRCTFCSLWKLMEGKYHLRDIDNVVTEMSMIQEPFVFLIDDEAFINGPRMLTLASALQKAQLRKYYFAYCRIDTLLRQKEVLQAWKAIGLERLFVGIDAISANTLDEYNKSYQISQIEAGLKVAREIGIEIFAQFVVHPSFTKREFQQLTRFIEHHQISYPSFTVLTPLPGTQLLETFDAVTELQANGRPNWDLFDCQNAVIKTALPPDEFRQEYRNLYRIFKGSYTKYREQNHLVDAAFHERSAVAQ
jgi:radical SAM superfamily enzyme YgiQ (UPF0313 family)